MIDEKEIERIMLDAYETWLNGRPPGRVPWSIDAAHAIAEAEAEKMREGFVCEVTATVGPEWPMDFSDKKLGVLLHTIASLPDGQLVKVTVTKAEEE